MTKNVEYKNNARIDNWTKFRKFNRPIFTEGSCRPGNFLKPTLAEMENNIFEPAFLLVLIVFLQGMEQDTTARCLRARSGWSGATYRSSTWGLSGTAPFRGNFFPAKNRMEDVCRVSRDARFSVKVRHVQVQFCGSGREPDRIHFGRLDADPHWEYGSGSRRQKWPTKVKKF